MMLKALLMPRDQEARYLLVWGVEWRPLAPVGILVSVWRRLESDRLKAGTDPRQDAVVEVQAGACGTSG